MVIIHYNATMADYIYDAQKISLFTPFTPNDIFHDDKVLRLARPNFTFYCLFMH